MYALVQSSLITSAYISSFFLPKIQAENSNRNTSIDLNSKAILQQDLLSIDAKSIQLDFFAEKKMKKIRTNEDKTGPVCTAVWSFQLPKFQVKIIIGQGMWSKLFNTINVGASLIE